MVDRVLDAAQSFIIDHVARYADDEQIADPLVEHDLRRDAGIRTADNDGKWMLYVSQLRASFRGLAGMLQTTARVPSVAFLELRDCLRWSYRRGIRMSRIGSAGKLVHSNETNENEARCEMCFFHGAVYGGSDLSDQSKSEFLPFKDCTRACASVDTVGYHPRRVRSS